MIEESELTPQSSGFQPKTQTYAYLSAHLEDEGEVGAETSSSSYSAVGNLFPRCGLIKLLLRMCHPTYAYIWGLTWKRWE